MVLRRQLRGRVGRRRESFRSAPEAQPRVFPCTAADGRPPDAREAELEHLLRLAHLLHVTMDAEAMQRTLQEHLGPLVGGRVVRLTLSGAVADPARPTAAGESFPLIAEDEIVGTLDVSDPAGDRPRALSARQRHLLELASPLVGRAVLDARLLRGARQLSAIDVLTGCLARRHGMELVGTELRRARRYDRPVALLFADLDRFKQVNDRYGHVFGDAVLRGVAAALKAALRGSDLCCRYGGDEFVMLLPETPLVGARHVADSLRRRLAGTTVEHSEGPIAITASIGVAVARPGELDADGLLARADAAMYRAKRAGRNAVCAWEEGARNRQAGY